MQIHIAFYLSKFPRKKKWENGTSIVQGMEFILLTRAYLLFLFKFYLPQGTFICKFHTCVHYLRALFFSYFSFWNLFILTLKDQLLATSKHRQHTCDVRATASGYCSERFFFFFWLYLSLKNRNQSLHRSYYVASFSPSRSLSSLPPVLRVVPRVMGHPDALLAGDGKGRASDLGL